MDVCIVGGGVVGCAAAWELARRGHGVVVLEAHAVASGASGGLGERGVRANMRERAELPLARRAQELWPRLDAALGSETGYRRIGHVQLIERPEDLALAERIVEDQRASGIECELVSGEAVRELEPGVCEDVVACVHAPGDGVADHTRTTLAFAAAARREGAEIREGVEVRRVVGDGGAVGAVETSDGTLPVEGALLVAANTGAAPLLEGVGMRWPGFEVYPQVLVTRPVATTVVRHLVGHASRPLAAKALASGSVMITGGRLGREGHVVPEEVQANLADAVAVFPALAGVAVDVAVADRAESVTPDLLPVVDRIASNAFLAAGWSGHGWAIAPAVAEAVRAWVEEGRRPEALVPFGLDRFAH